MFSPEWSPQFLPEETRQKTKGAEDEKVVGCTKDDGQKERKERCCIVEKKEVTDYFKQKRNAQKDRRKILSSFQINTKHLHSEKSTRSISVIIIKQHTDTQTQPLSHIIKKLKFS